MENMCVVCPMSQRFAPKRDRRFAARLTDQQTLPSGLPAADASAAETQNPSVRPSRRKLPTLSGGGGGVKLLGLAFNPLTLTLLIPAAHLTGSNMA